MQSTLSISHKLLFAQALADFASCNWPQLSVIPGAQPLVIAYTVLVIVSTTRAAHWGQGGGQ
jgi:hypothetical protein